MSGDQNNPWRNDLDRSAQRDDKNNRNGANKFKPFDEPPAGKSPELFERKETSSNVGRANEYLNVTPASPRSNYDPNAFTPWKRHREAGPGDKTRRKKLLTVLGVSICFALGLQFFLAASFLTNNLHWNQQQVFGWAKAQLGVTLGSNDMILSGYKEGWGENPAGVSILLGLANSRAGNDDKNAKAAMPIYDEIIRINPTFPNGWMNRGRNYQALGDNTKALSDFSQAIALDPKYALAYNNKGCLYLEQEKYDSALQCFTKAMELDPKRFDYPYNRSLVFERTKQKQKALRDCDLAEPLARNNAERKQVDYERTYIKDNL
ncbi:MAG TPA: tetratricopeptide repeat protein [Drouetiella sp.]